MSDLLERAREAAKEPQRNGDGWYCCNCGELIGELCDEIIMLRKLCEPVAQTEAETEFWDKVD